MTRSEEIKNALNLIADILRDNELEISEHAGGLSLWDAKEKKMWFFDYQVIPSGPMTLWSMEGNK